MTLSCNQTYRLKGVIATLAYLLLHLDFALDKAGILAAKLQVFFVDEIGPGEVIFPGLLKFDGEHEHDSEGLEHGVFDLICRTGCELEVGLDCLESFDFVVLRA